MPPSSPALAAVELAPTGALEALSNELSLDTRLASLPAHLELVRLLGQGGSSVVYEALHTRLKVKVAIKLLNMDGPYAEQAQKRMLREAELYALLDDPRIPRVYDVNELPDGTPYVVMEMVPGESLEELILRRGRLSPQHALQITREILLTLASVHERGVLHRDVKPANVILTLSHDEPSEVRLVDFGIAKMSTRGTGEEAVTQRGALIGTPHYMAPECMAGHPANASTDVYAVGIMLYEMLAGAVPFTGQSLALVMAAVMRQTPLSLEERGIDVTPELSALVMKAMAREPSDRFLSASDMLSAVEALAPRDGSVLPELEALPRKRRRGRFWFLAALLSTLLICAGFLLAGKRIDLAAEAQPASAPTGNELGASGGTFPRVSAPMALERHPQGVPPALRVEPGSASPAVEKLAPKHKRHHRDDSERARERPDDERQDRDPDDALILPENPY